MVATYDRAPAMSAKAVTDAVCDAVQQQVYSLIVVNYANPDMVGHTGNIEAAIEAIQTVDNCLGRLLETIIKVGGTTLITADHGNAEYIRDEAGNPWTAHTTNPVPLMVIGAGNFKLRDDGSLCDIVPTALDIMGLEQPPEMTGKSLIIK